jgi:Arc/MetJ-type ribon-helix-helix transcriptional regulator
MFMFMCYVIAIIINMAWVLLMKTVQMTLDDDLVRAVDDIVKQQRTSRSEFTRKALRHALKQFRDEQMEKAHRNGYANKPVGTEEFSVWDEEQEWGDA